MFLLQKAIFYFLFNIFIFFIFKINISSENLSDLPILYRLNNGNYIVLTISGIYLYDKNLISNKIISSFDSNITMNFSQDKIETYFSQFLNEDDGYIIILINDKIYFLSKYAEILTEYTLDFFDKTIEYSIITYSHLNDEYFFVILYYKSGICFTKYKYNSSNNSILFIEKINQGETVYLSTCKLMKNNKNNILIVCVECGYARYIYIYNTTNFGHPFYKDFIDENIYDIKSYVEENKLNIMHIFLEYSGGTFYYKYNIDYDSILEGITLNFELYKNTLTIEYFKEIKEFVFLNFKNGIFNLIRISNDFDFQNGFNITDKIDMNTCSSPTRINLFYSQQMEKYGIFTNFTNSNCQTIIYLTEIDSPRLIDFIFDESSILICNNYYNYNKTDCIDTIPNGFYCNNSIEKSKDKCHENCETCIKGPTNNFNNCESCKKNYFKKYNDIFNNGSFINCYNNLEKYYLNNN